MNQNLLSSIGVSKEQVVDFLNRWLVNYQAVKFEKSDIELVRKLTPMFSYQGELQRGLFAPFITRKRHGATEMLESWSKSVKGIQNFESYAEYAFGTVRVMDNTIEVYTEEEFLRYNQDANRLHCDRVIVGTHTGLDLEKLAKYVGYRNDFLAKLREVEEVLVIQKT